jgi:hypothetical protein
MKRAFLIHPGMVSVIIVGLLIALALLITKEPLVLFATFIIPCIQSTQIDIDLVKEDEDEDKPEMGFLK